jgi:hypothetical protein
LLTTGFAPVAQTMQNVDFVILSDFSASQKPLEAEKLPT